ncbi:MAG TPA: Trm112 family protein [Nitrososphaeraceae archaeon]|nr:Trm112 family protein [Nitrososphaeraceae archaeon]
MKKHMLDILACPMDKNYPLDLIELHVKELENDNLRESNFKFPNDEKKTIKNNLTVNQEINNIRAEVNKDKDKVIVIIEGILYCRKCLRFYPIIDEIPIMLPDELREKEKDLEFLNKWKNNIPQKILKNANPWHL